MTQPAPFWTVPGPHCPQCAGRDTFLVSDSIGPPEPGDLLVCCLCWGLNVVTPALQLREFTDGDFEYYDPDAIARMFHQIAEFRNQTRN